MAPAKSTGDLLIERFVSKVEQTKTCWLWRGTNYHRSKINYGKIQVCGKEYSAHRMSWTLFRGEIPRGLHVLHKCDVPLCVRPVHLWLGTAAENCTDRKLKGRNKHPIGETVGTSKLTSNDVLEIRSLFSSGKFTHLQLAKKFGVTRENVGRIIRRISWKHI